MRTRSLHVRHCTVLWRTVLISTIQCIRSWNNIAQICFKPYYNYTMEYYKQIWWKVDSMTTSILLVYSPHRWATVLYCTVYDSTLHLCWLRHLVDRPVIIQIFMDTESLHAVQSINKFAAKPDARRPLKDWKRSAKCSRAKAWSPTLLNTTKQ